MGIFISFLLGALVTFIGVWYQSLLQKQKTDEENLQIRINCINSMISEIDMNIRLVESGDQFQGYRNVDTLWFCNNYHRYFTITNQNVWNIIRNYTTKTSAMSFEVFLLHKIIEANKFV